MNHINKKYIIYLCLYSILFHFSSLVSAKEAKESTTEPPKIGNFALPSSQQPGSLISFGQNIIEKGDTLLYVVGDDFVGGRKHFVDAIPYLLYGINDKSSILFSIPYAVDYRDQKNRSSGVEDAVVQYEYAFFTSPANTLFTDAATVVANVFFPTGSSNKEPPTGFGSSSFFLGLTYSRLYTDWYYFVSPGVLLTTKHHGTQFGREYFYQAGFGKNMCYLSSDWILAWVLEADGLYTEKTVFQGEVDPNTGGNIVYLTPSLFFSTQKLIVQLGVAVPATQHWYGEQTKFKYLIVGNVAWKF